MDENNALDMLSALSQETRLRVIRYLVQCGAGGAPAGEVGMQVEASSSRISFHLSALEHAGLITSERRSRHIFYRANYETLGGLVSFLLNDCCGNHPDIRACCNLENGRC